MSVKCKELVLKMSVQRIYNKRQGYDGSLILPREIWIILSCLSKSPSREAVR